MKQIARVMTVTVVAVVILIGLLFLSDHSDIGAGGFNRKFFRHPINKVSDISIKDTIFNFIGSTSYSLFFSGNNYDYIYRIDRSFKSVSKIAIPFSIPNANHYSVFELYADSPYVYCYLKNFSAILYFNFINKKNSIVRIEVPLVTRVCNLSDSFIAIRGFDSSSRFQLFQKVNRFTGVVVNVSNLLLGKQDAGFSSDGLLKHDAVSGKSVYMQFYQNKYFIFDADMNFVDTGKTIDTINYNSVIPKLVGKDSLKKSLMPSTPMRSSNKYCFVENGNLFVLSTLKADNEGNQTFHKNSVIDIYGIGTKSYRGSFYVPDFDGEKLESIYWLDNMLVGLYKRHIVTYQIPSFEQL